MMRQDTVKAAMVLFMIFYGLDAYAALPTAPTDLTNNAGDWITGLGAQVKKGLMIALPTSLTLCGIFFLNMGWQSYSEANRHGNYFKFGMNMVIGAILFGVSIFMVTQSQNIWT